MKIWQSPEQIPADLGRTVVTIGVFDGVHKGHHAILSETVRQACERAWQSVALTFDPHPATIHRPEMDVHLISTVDDRLDRLESAGIDCVFVQHYTREYSSASAEDFVANQLIEQLKAGAVVVGEDVRFGSGNTGDGDLLRELGAKYGIDVTLVSDLTGMNGRRWSSTWIREALAAGDVKTAAQVLGRPHRLRGQVQHGYKRGRELGFPTANLSGNDIGEVPADGVYAGWLVRQGPDPKARVYLPSAISVGTNPQFGSVERTVEAHVLGRSDLNLYGEEIAVDFVDFVRPMLAFDSVEELLEQMDDDLRRTAEVLGVPVAGRVDPSEVTAS